MVENFEFKQGEKKFLENFEKIHKKRPHLYEKTPEERIKHTIEEIKNQINDLPEIKREKEFHHNIPQEEINNIIAQAIQIALNEDLKKAIKFVYKTKNPYIIDAFHDILINHFVNVVNKKNNIN